MNTVAWGPRELTYKTLIIAVRVRVRISYNCVVVDGGKSLALTIQVWKL